MAVDLSQGLERTRAMSRRPRVFVAIPCGAFYSVQADIIRDLFASADIDAYIAEDSSDTKGLWDSISVQIDKADVFIADISSGSPNILLEVGYAIARKPIGAIGLFISNQIDVPSDLRWVVVQIYSSLSSFSAALDSWTEKAFPLSRPSASRLAPTRTDVFSEDFMRLVSAAVGHASRMFVFSYRGRSAFQQRTLPDSHHPARHHGRL